MVELEKWQTQGAKWAQELVEIDRDLETEEVESMRAILLDDNTHAQKMLCSLDPLLEAIGYWQGRRRLTRFGGRIPASGLEDSFPAECVDDRCANNFGLSRRRTKGGCVLHGCS